MNSSHWSMGIGQSISNWWVRQYQCTPRLVAPKFMMAHCQPRSHLEWCSCWMSRFLLVLALNPSRGRLCSPRQSSWTCFSRPLDPNSVCCLDPVSTPDNRTHTNSSLLMVSDSASLSAKGASRCWMWDTSCEPSQLSTLLAPRTYSVAVLRPAEIESSLLHHSVGEYWAQWVLASLGILYRISEFDESSPPLSVRRHFPAPYSATNSFRNFSRASLFFTTYLTTASRLMSSWSKA